jgi:hypothetical protein
MTAQDPGHEQNTEQQPAPQERSSARGAVRGSLTGLAADVGLPVGTYYVLHAFGASDTVALLAGTLVAGARMAVVAIRSRRITPFSALMFAVYAVGLALSLINGDPRFLLVKESFGTGVVGLAFLVSLVVGRPMILETMRNLPTSQSADLVRRYATEPAVRHTVRLLTAIWGVGLLVDALVRIPVVYALPISVGVAVSPLLTVGFLVALGGVTALVVRRARRRASRATT